MSEEQEEEKLKRELARRTRTNSADWHLVLKARYGMNVVFETLKKLRGKGSVVTSAFTCCTAIDPITAAGHTPVYADLTPNGFSLDLSTVELGSETRAVVLQHSFGLIDSKADEQLVATAHKAGALVVEDSAHCVCRMSHDAAGEPLCDISIHSFGIEKMLENSYFGGAVWLSRNMDEQVREELAAALDALSVPDEALDHATRNYRNQIRVLTRVPSVASHRIKEGLVARGSHEPGIAEDELRGKLPLKPMRPTPWICERVLDALKSLNTSEHQRATAVKVYNEVFAEVVAEGEAPEIISSELAAMQEAQPLLRYPVRLSTTERADRVIEHVNALGNYCVDWYRPLLYPGVLDEDAYGWGDKQRAAHPQTCAMSEGIACLPTDVSEDRAREIAHYVLAMEGCSHLPSIETESGRIAVLKDEDEVRKRLVPVVLGGDILGYAYTREFHRAYGIRTIILSAVNVRSTSASRFCDYRVVENLGDEETCVEYLKDLGRELALQGKIGLLLGCADWHARILSTHKEELSRWYVVPYIDFPLLDDITKKERFYDICEELDIAYPKTWYLDCSDHDAVLDTSQFPYPLIAKPSNSASYDLLEFHGKKKIYEIETPEELAHVYDIVREAGYPHKLVIQEFVPGDDDAIRSLTIYADENGEARVVAGGQVVLQDHSPIALGNPVCILSEKVDRIVEDGKRFLKHVGYHGYANFDIKYDRRDGKCKFFEVNTRPGRNTYYVSLGGVNFVTPIVEDQVLGRELPYREAYDPYVYTVIPAQIVEKTVTNTELREQVLEMYRTRKAQSPLWYTPDTLQHKFWARLMWQHQVAKFKQYVWDTGGKQASVE